MVATLQVLVVLTVAAVAHCTFAWAMPAIIWPDSIRYADLAAELPSRLTGDWDSFSAPGYPAFLWVCGRWIATADGVAWVQQGLAICACALTWSVVRHACGLRAALLGGLIVALSPERHYYAQTMLSECLSEFVFVAGISLMVVAGNLPNGTQTVVRSIAGVALSAAALIRFNMIPATLAATVISRRPRVAQSGATRLGATGIAAPAAWLGVVLAWLVFLTQQDIHSLPGNAARLFNGFANEHGIGQTVAVPTALTPGLAREQEHALWERIGANRAAYGRAVLRTARALVFSFVWRGDVAPSIPECSPPPPGNGSPRGFAERPRPLRGVWRLKVHRALSSLYKLLTPLGWIGLAVWGVAVAGRGRLDLFLLAAAPLVGIAALSLMVMINTRYTFPFDALALGIGIPGGWSVVERWCRRLRRAALRRREEAE